MLRRLVGAERAAEMVGDLLERRAGASVGALTWADGVRFWASVVWLCVVFSWRTPVATVAAVVAGIYFGCWPFGLAVSHRVVGHPVPEYALGVASYCLGFSMLLWAEAVFAFVRFGVRDELTKLGVKAAVLGTFAACCLWWLPHASVLLLVGVAALTLFQMASEDRRRVLAVWLMVVLGTWFAARFLLTSAFAKFHVGPGKLDLYSTLYLYVSMFSGPLLLAFTSVLLHRRLLGEAKEVVS